MTGSYAKPFVKIFTANLATQTGMIAIGKWNHSWCDIGGRLFSNMTQNGFTCQSKSPF